MEIQEESAADIIKRISSFDRASAIPKFKVSEPYSESKNSFFIELARNLPPPKERKKYTEAEILAMQPASTRKLMLMTDEEHRAFHESPISTEGQTTLADLGLSDEEKAAKIGQRNISPEEFAVHDAYRKASKNTQHQFDKGHGNLLATGISSVTPETRQKAIDAYLYSPPVPADEVDPDRIEGLKQVKSADPEILQIDEKIRKSTFGGAWKFFTDWVNSPGIKKE